MSTNQRLIDHTGQTFGRWTVVEKAGNSPRGAALWRCLCACGETGLVLGGDLRRGASRSCGCEGSRAKVGQINKTHGGTGSRLYTTWKNMRARCAPDGSPRYGIRGIRVCAEWEDFSAFKAWAESEGYDDTLTIERRDVDKGYEPSNCCWVKRALQAKNKSNNVKAPDGRLWQDIAIENGISASAFRCRISAAGWPPEKAATTPMGRGRRTGPRSKDGTFSKSDKKEWRR